MFDVIVNLATPPMKGALAVIRLSGEGSLSIVQKIFTGKIEEPNRVYFGYIVDPDSHEKVDQVLAVYFKEPKSFTGEDVVEISCHGSMIIADEIIGLCLRYSARLSMNGEFSARAFYHGKIDLVQAEAINSLIQAETSRAKRNQMFALTGETSSLIRPVKEKIADILASIEVNIDYPEYRDIETLTEEQILSSVDSLCHRLDELIANGERAKRIDEGIDVAIIGRPNVGKSSLLNALIKQDKAIVTNVPGTTRDVVEGKVVLNGLTFHLLDTAGIHRSIDEIEQAGIEKSKQMAEKADLVLLVLEADRFTPEDRELLNLTEEMQRIIVYNKKERVPSSSLEEDRIYVSALNKDISALEEAMKKKFGVQETKEQTPSFCSAREIALLKKCKDSLLSAKKETEEGVSLDLVAVEIKSAYDALKDLLGEEVRVDLEQEIFSRFCVGK